MRTSLFFSGLFAGGFMSRRYNIFGADPNISSIHNINNSTAGGEETAFALGNSPRPVQDADIFRKGSLWWDVPTRPFSARYRHYVLGDIINLTHDVALFRFLLPNEDDEFHLRPCSTLQARVQFSGNASDTIERFYTPVTQNGSKGYFDFIVKRKPTGHMTNQLFGMRVGDTMQFRCVAFKLKYTANRWDEVGMICGGTGFTPMLQVIRHALQPVEDPFDDAIRSATASITGAAATAAAPSSSSSSSSSSDAAIAQATATATAAVAALPVATPVAASKKSKIVEPDRTKLSLLFCNRTENHILLRHVFEQLAEQYPDRFRVKFCVDKAVNPDTWAGYTGYVTEEMIRETMPHPDTPRSIILLCGPDHLLHHVAGTSYYALHTLSSGKKIQPIGVDLANLTTVEGLLGKMGYCKQLESDSTKVCDVYKF